MKVNMLKGKIHRATVVQAELNYVGSITVDKDINFIRPKMNDGNWRTPCCSMTLLAPLTEVAP